MSVWPFRSANRLALLGLAILVQTARLGWSAPEPLPLQLEVFVNGAPKNLIAAFALGEDGTLSTTAGELEEIGLRAPLDGDAVVALDRLEGIRFRYDEALQQIFFDAEPSALAVQRLDASAPEPAPDAAGGDWGGVLNYGVFASSGFRLDELDRSNDPGLSLSLDGRLFAKPGVLSQSAIARNAGDSLELLRLDTTFERADPDRLVTYRAGDVISGGLSWTRPIRLAGLQAQRRFALRPDLVTRPLPSFSGSAAVPSTVDVYVDGLRLFSRDVDAGPFEVTDLPLVSRSGEATVVVRDAAGREVAASLPFFSSGDLLRPGLSDFSVEAGVARRDFGSASDQYDDRPVAAATLRLGVHDWLTVEGHAEGGAGLVNAGGGLVASAGRWGTVAAGLAASRTDGGAGLLASLSVQSEVLGAQVGASLRQTMGDYEDLASVTALRDGRRIDEAFGPAKRAISVSVGSALPGDMGSVSLNFVHLEEAGGDRSAILAGSFSRETGFGGHFTASAFGELEGQGRLGAFAGFSMPLGEEMTVGLQGSGGDGSFSLEAAKTPTGEPGEVGWRMRAERTGDGAAAVAGSASHRSRYARSEAQARLRDGRVDLLLDVEGAVSTVNGAVLLSNRIDDGFALVETGTPGVEVRHENRLVGVTDRRGRLLVPNLRSYEKNRLTISPDNLPLDAHVAATESTVVPSDRAGVTVDLAVVADARAAIVALKDENGVDLPAGSEGRLNGGETFIVGYDGETYLSGLKARNTLLVLTETGQCSAAFAYAPKAGNRVVIPSVACVPSRGEAANAAVP